MAVGVGLVWGGGMPGRGQLQQSWPMPGSGRDVRMLCGVHGTELQCIHFDAGVDTTWIGVRGGLRGARVQGVRGRRVWERMRGGMPGGGQLQQSWPMPGSGRDVRVRCRVRGTELQCIHLDDASKCGADDIEHDAGAYILILQHQCYAILDEQQHECGIEHVEHDSCAHILKQQLGHAGPDDVKQQLEHKCCAEHVERDAGTHVLEYHARRQAHPWVALHCRGV